MTRTSLYILDLAQPAPLVDTYRNQQPPPPAMSHFPHLDPTEERDGLNHNSTYLDMQTARTSSQKSCDLWSTAPVTMPASDQAFHEFQTMSWAQSEPQDLETLALPACTQQTWEEATTTTTAAPSQHMQMSWAPDYAVMSQTMTNQMTLPRKEPWSDAYGGFRMGNPFPGWEHPQQGDCSTTTTYDTSPGQSEYSCSSRPSAMSSPYSNCEGHIRAGKSPMLKLEDMRDHNVAQFHFMPETTPLSHSALICPGELASPPSGGESMVAGASHSTCGSDWEDEQSQTHRSALRRAFACRAHPGRARPKRGYTTAENANCSCRECGKLFQRSYNLKAHMDTHDPHRPQPHICPYVGCGKRFVRRTDLMRHEHSVHLKARDHVCELCNGAFARRDTLRRHIDDGCPRRPEVKKRGTKTRRATAATHGAKKAVSC